MGDGSDARLAVMLRLYRVRHGLTQQELGRQVGLSVRALRDLEQGRVRQPRPASLRRLAAVLDLDPAEAVTAWQEDHPPRSPAARAREVAGQPATDGLESGLEIGVLGPLRVQRRGQPLRIGSLKQRGLLGFLALHPDGVVGRDELVDVLWDRNPPASCRDLVTTYVARLRRVLAPPPAPTATSAIVAVGDGYRLMVDAAGLDLLRFETLTARARAVQATDPAAACALLGQALDCWRGPVLADLPGVLHQHPAAVAAAQRRLAAGLAHAELALALGEHQQAADQLRRLTPEEPLHERLHARLMLALAGCGQQAAALEVFAALRDRLAGELGVDPSPNAG
jgi:DNA-binding SARP family transcriptional activator/DNA-binding XRE family transcriptional regulator